jgi:hypothetical protein
MARTATIDDVIVDIDLAASALLRRLWLADDRILVNVTTGLDDLTVRLPPVCPPEHRPDLVDPIGRLIDATALLAAAGIDTGRLPILVAHLTAWSTG